MISHVGNAFHTRTSDRNQADCQRANIVEHTADIETYDDHRMAMSFAVTSLRSPGIRILNPECTAKTFPNYFDRLIELTGTERL